jgi:hypothetical protein
MSVRTAIAVLIALAAVAAGAFLIAGGDDGDKASASAGPIPGLPAVEVVSPRNGSRHENRSVVVKLKIENFKLAPLHFGHAPELGEGHIKFSLNRVPDCVDPEKLERAINSPFGSGRLIGRSFDLPKHSGPNGVLAERIGTAGLYSPATLPEIYYERLPPGFYRLIITLARNDGTSTPFHAVTNFEILPDPRRLESGDPPPPPPDCAGKVSSAEAARRIR